LHGSKAGLEAVAEIPKRERLESHYLLHAVVGELHWRLKNHGEAAASFRRALQLAQVGPEQLYLTRMLDRSTEADDQPATPSRSRVPATLAK
jgi:predicted RNA polymerase sigma factor